MPSDKNKEESEAAGRSVARDGDTIRSLPISTGVSQRGVRTPSYAQSQYETVVRRQRIHNALKIPHRLYRTTTADSTSTLGDEEEQSYPPRTVHEWDFAGWGTMSFAEVSEEEVRKAREEKEEERRKAGDGALGSWRAAGVAGVAVAGSPLYAFPALVGVAGIYSPISLFVATLLLSLWRPIMEELASAISIDGANYSYLLNSSALKDVAIFGAALTLLDDVATSVVSAGTAAAYIATEAGLRIDVALTVVLIVGIALFGLLGIKGNAEVMTTVLVFHLITFAMIFVAGAVHWGQVGNAVLRENWATSQPGSAGGIIKQIFLGVCVGFLGVTGFETAPDYISSVRTGVYPSVLRSLQAFAITCNAPLMLVTFAVLPMSDVLGNPSVLSSVAQQAAGGWLRIWVTVDAVLILSATILTGAVSADALIGRLAGDGIFPSIFLRRMPWTGAPYLSLALFAAVSLAIYGTTGASLTIMSSIFAIVFLSIMLLFPVSLLLLSFSRPSLPRSPRTSLSLSLLVLALSLTLIIGNIVMSPIIAGYLAAYVLVMGLVMILLSKRSRAMKVLIHSTERVEWMKRWGLSQKVVEWMKSMKGGPVVLFVATDEIHKLFELLTYVRNNEETSCVKVVHCYRQTEDIPSELEPNCKILDEAFPSITVDLVLLQGAFSPSLVDAFTSRLDIATSRCFVSAMDDQFPYALHEFGGVRVVMD